MLNDGTRPKSSLTPAQVKASNLPDPNIKMPLENVPEQIPVGEPDPASGPLVEFGVLEKDGTDLGKRVKAVDLASAQALVDPEETVFALIAEGETFKP